MRSLQLTALALALCALRGTTALHAQDAQPRAQLGAHASVARSIATTNAEDPTASGTSIDTTARSGARESVSDVLLEIPGARPIRTGALGSFTSASLRGAQVEHTAVLLGEIPISSADAAAFNFSTVPLELLERVTVYRGGAPVWVGQGAIGGVVQLVPRRARSSELAITGSAGSFDTYGVDARSAVAGRAPRDPKLLGAVGALGSSGDFEYRFDGRTTFDASDDRMLRRKNAHFIEGHGLMRLEQPIGPGALELLALGYTRNGGEPGVPKDPLLDARRGFTRGVLGLGYTIEQRQPGDDVHALRLQALGSLHFTRSQLSDLYSELGPSGAVDSDDRTLDARGRIAASAAVAPFLELTLVTHAGRESHAPEDPFDIVPLPASLRTSLAAALEAHAHGRVLGHAASLRGSVRAERVAAELHRERFGTLRASEAEDLLPTYRVAGALELFAGLALSASVASGARAPSVLELFGDNAFILGNVGLRPEHSRSFEVGLVHNAQLGDFCSSFEARAFDLAIDDQIIFTRNSFSQLRPFNLADSHVKGVELGVRAAYTRHLALTASATFLDTEGKPGRSLPDRPRAVVFVQPAAHSGPVLAFDDLGAFFEVAYTASSFDDPDNQALPKPPQALVDAGLSSLFWSERALLRITLTDVFDRGGQDLRGFPLPGRSVMASLTYEEDLL